MRDEKSGEDDKDASADAAFPRFAWGYAGEELVLTQEGAADIGACIIDPKEHKHREGNRPHKVNTRGVRLEGQDVQQREGQGDIELTHHRVGPVVDGVFLFQIELCHHQIDQRNQVWYEDGGRRDATAETCHCQEEVHACYRGNHLIDGYAVTIVHKARKLPDGHARYKSKQQDHGFRAQETTHNSGYEKHRCYCSDDEILHNFVERGKWKEERDYSSTS